MKETRYERLTDILEHDFADVAMAESMDFWWPFNTIREFIDYMDENYMEGALEEYNESYGRCFH